MIGCGRPKRCLPGSRRRREKLLQQDSAGVFSAYQVFLGGIQTLSTLLMGFLITGTLLGVSLTGTENYGTQQMYEFTMTAVLSAILAGISLLLAFIVIARGTTAYENFGAVRAVKSMRRSTICICLAEGCIYWSLLFFIVSLQSYILMCYIGPDICPYTRRGQPSGESICSQLGDDFFWAMKKSCEGGDIIDAEDDLPSLPASGGDVAGDAGQKVLVSLGNTSDKRDRIDSGFVCSQYALLQRMPRLLEPPLTPKNFAVWGCTMYYEQEGGSGIVASEDCGAPDHMQLINDVSEVLCSVPKASELRRTLCGHHTSESHDASEQCAQAFVAYRKAMDCVDQSLEDAKKCYQVCQWTEGEPNRKRLQTSIESSFNLIYVGLFLTFFGRLARGLQQTHYVFATDDKPVCTQVLHQLFFRDPESSDEEEDAEDAVDRFSSSSAGPWSERCPPKSCGPDDWAPRPPHPDDRSSASGGRDSEVARWCEEAPPRGRQVRDLRSEAQFAYVPYGIPRGWGPGSQRGPEEEPEPEAEVWSFW